MKKNVTVIGEASLNLKSLQNEFIKQGKLSMPELRERNEAESPSHRCGCDSDCHCPSDS